MKLIRPNEVGNRPMNTRSREGAREREPAAGSANVDTGMKTPWRQMEGVLRCA